MTRCPNDLQLEQLLDGTAPRVRGWFRRRHVRSCQRCQVRYAELEADRQLVDDLRGAFGGLTPEFAPPTASHRPDTGNSDTTAVFPNGAEVSVPDTLPDIPGYDIEAVIARGGMGVVYRARHRHLNRPAAVKMILGGGHLDPTARVRFQVEAEAVAALDHPNIVHVHEFGTHDGVPFFALEFVGGGTLAERLARDGRPSPRAAAELVVKLADGIAAAHAKGIVHRDLKPANVLLTPPAACGQALGGRHSTPPAAESLPVGDRHSLGEPKVADFGLAKIGQSGMTTTGAVMGTPSYMSPEQAAGRTNEIGTHSDIYALGAILYELLTGRPAFEAGSAMATIQQVLTREPERPRGIDAGIPRDLETIALKCLAKEPGGRYSTASELAADLRAYLDGRTITARPAGTVERTWKWVRRNPVVTGAAVAVALALTAGTTVSYLKYRDAEHQKGIAQQEAAKADAASDYLVGILDLAGSASRRSTTPRQILDAAEKEIPVKFADQPELRDKLLAQIGGVYDRMTADAPLAMLLEVSGTVRLESAREPARRAVPQTLLYASDRLNLGADGRARLVSLSDLHQEQLKPIRDVTVRRRGCEPADAVTRDDGLPMTFAPLPKGTFYMGWNGRLNPAKKTVIPEDFEIAVHLVTQGQWEAVMGENPCYFARRGVGQKAVQDISDEELKLFPVDTVSWHDAQKFIRKLNEKERARGWVYRLPTEAEWEYACRAGATSEADCSHYFYLDTPTNKDLTPDQANFNDLAPPGKSNVKVSPERTTRVGAYPPNKLGLCDMHGNLWQWTADMEEGNSDRIQRGGSYQSQLSKCQANARQATGPKYQFVNQGFRLVRVPAPAR